MLGRKLQTTITDETPHVVVNFLRIIIYTTHRMNHFIAARAPMPGMEIYSREDAFVATNT